jgi:hypothetical protein
LADEAVDRISSVSATVWDKITNRSGDVQQHFTETYEAFLLRELDKLNQRKTKKTTDVENVDSENSLPT